MKKITALLMLLGLMLPWAQAEYWDAGNTQSVVFCNQTPGCQVLQAVMLGSFADFDPEDSLNTRVYSAALPRLIAVTKADFGHFSEHFGAEEETVRKLYYIALLNCFRSDVLINPIADTMDEQNARTVISLFMSPSDEATDAEKRAIRANCSETELKLLAENAGLPLEFVRYLITGTIGF